MDKLLFQIITGQLSKLIHSRGYDVREYKFLINGVNIDIYRHKQQLVSLNTEIYTIKDIVSHNDVWKKHKTDILNDALLTASNTPTVIYAYEVSGVKHNPYML